LETNFDPSKNQGFCGLRFPVSHPLFEKPQTSKRSDLDMVTLPISPLVFSVLTTVILIVTFYLGRWCGINWCAGRLLEIGEKYDEEE
jgi:hypothetical protein